MSKRQRTDLDALSDRRGGTGGTPQPAMQRYHRATLFIDPELHRRIKSLASLRGQKMSTLIVELIQRELDADGRV